LRASSATSTDRPAERSHRPCPHHGRALGRLFAPLNIVYSAFVESPGSHLLAKLQVRNRVEAVLICQRIIADHTSVIAMDAPALAMRQGATVGDGRARCAS
jgi:hypothetical protein